MHEEATRLLVDALREEAPLGVTGETRRQIEAVPGGSARGFASTVRAPAPGGEYVEKGTEPHDIFPRNARVLRFLGGSGRISQPSPNQRIATIGGGVVYAAVVHHPGTPPRPWFAPTVERWPEFLERALANIG